MSPPAPIVPPPTPKDPRYASISEGIAGLLMLIALGAALVLRFGPQPLTYRTWGPTLTTVAVLGGLGAVLFHFTAKGWARQTRWPWLTRLAPLLVLLCIVSFLLYRQRQLRRQAVLDTIVAPGAAPAK